MKNQTLIAVLTALGTSAGASAGLIANGDFESGTSLPAISSAQLTDWDSWTEIAGTKAPVGWLQGSNFGGAVDVPATNVVVNLGALNAIEQDITTVIGETYTINYDLGGLGGSAAPAYDATVVVSADGVAVDTQVVSQTAGGTGFINSFSVDFVATDTTTTIRFENTVDPTADDFGAVIDNVDVVPEPGSLGLLGLGGLLIARRRRA